MAQTKRPAGQEGAHPRIELRPHAVAAENFQAPRLTQESAERFLVGQLSCHPERLARVTLHLDHFTSANCVTLFRALRECRDAPDHLVSITRELQAGQVPATFLVEVIEEWCATPWPLRDLERYLDERLRRRRFCYIADALRAAANDSGADLDLATAYAIERLSRWLP